MTGVEKGHEKVEGRRKEIEMVLSSLYLKSLEKKVKLHLDVRKGKIKALGIGHAMMLKATHLVLGRELKMYKNHFVKHLPCTIIQMRRKRPPRTFQGVQSAMVVTNGLDFDDFSSCSDFRISTSQSSPHIENLHIPVMNTDFFSVEMAKQSLDNWAEMPERPLCDFGALAKLNGYGPVVISKGSGLLQPSLYQQARLSTSDLADTLRRAEIMFSTSGHGTGSACEYCSSMCSVARSLHYDHSIASSASSRTSSFRSLPRQCSHAELLTLNHLQELENTSSAAKAEIDPTESEQELDNTSSAAKGGSPEIDLTESESHMQKLVDTSSAAKDGLPEIDLREIQENVKEVISLQRSEGKAHASRLVDSLSFKEGIAFDDCSFFGQEKQHTAENDSKKQVSGDVSKSRSPEEKTIIAPEVVVSTSNSVITLQPAEEHFCIVEEGRRSSALAFPFCPVCKQSPVSLGKRPLNFTHDQLSFATNGFSRENLLGGDDAGLAYKGLLQDGHAITVKKFKEPCISGDDDRLFEVQLLMSAQHRNLVMLLGVCIEDTHFMLVYEYACNKSLSWHLAKEHNPDGLQWWARQKIAVGVARALRYLHEECRAGCIVHRDIRADNIFLTHEFVPMVYNFGLACLDQDKMDGDTGREACSWKNDVYAFGVVLLELITGKQALDNSNTEFEQRGLVDWAQPLLLDGRYYELVDSRLESSHDSFELICMVRAALLCITNDPSTRPRMGQVMRILEGGNATDDEPRPIELFFGDESSIMHFEEQKEEKPKPHDLHYVTSNNHKPKRKYKGPSLTYNEMLD